MTMSAVLASPRKESVAAPNVGRKAKKRPRLERDLDDRQAYYDRLLHQCRRDLHKHAKVTKTFETQKLIRKIKEQKAGRSADAVALTTVAQELKLQQLKGFSLDSVIQEAVRRLGLLQLDPKLLRPRCDQQESIRSNGEDIAADAPNGPTEESHDDASNELDKSMDLEATLPKDQIEQNDPNVDDDEEEEESSNRSTAWIAERILRHKNMCTALERWNDQITEYRRWCLRCQERLEGIPREKTSKQSKPKNKQLHHAAAVTSNPLTAMSSMFVTLGDDNDNTTNGSDDPMAYYGPASGGMHSGGADIKKNRQGQRARRAKVAALDAKKQGRTLRPEESLNWRQPKARTEDESSNVGRSRHGSGGGGHRESRHGPIAPDKASRVEQSQPPLESLHPSWQARKEQKEGIVAFQGKKITFD